MRSPEDIIECLELAKVKVKQVAWALALHLPGGVGLGGGGAYTVERDAESVVGWIDDAIDRIKTDAKWIHEYQKNEKS